MHSKRLRKMTVDLTPIGKGIALAGLYIAGAWFAVKNPSQAEWVLGSLGGATLMILFFF